jgi:broad specificity phosphatase PhoE
MVKINGKLVPAAMLNQGNN